MAKKNVFNINFDPVYKVVEEVTQSYIFIDIWGENCEIILD